MPEVQIESADQIKAVDVEIADVRAKTTLSGDEVGQHLQSLYKKKSDILAGRPVEKLPESVDQKIEALRNDGTPNDERKGEKLLELYREKVSEKAGAPPADPEAISREIQTDLRNTWGSQYDPKMTGIGEVVLDVFEDVERFKAFSENLALDRDEQIDAMHQLSELAAPVKREMPIDQTNDVVTERLRAMWGECADENFEFAQRAAKAAFGTLEKYEQRITARGYAENPNAQTKLIVFLSRIGRKQTVTRQEEPEPVETGAEEIIDELEETGGSHEFR